MAFEFKNILSAMGLKNSTDPVTAANLQAADDKIALLEQEKSAAELKATQAEAARVSAQTALDTATTKLTTTEASLATATDKVATLEDWKKKQAAADGRTEDDSNSLDEDKGEPKASFEVAAQAVVARTKQRLGDK